MVADGLKNHSEAIDEVEDKNNEKETQQGPHRENIINRFREPCQRAALQPAREFTYSGIAN
jgi:hypothetical protein